MKGQMKSFRFAAVEIRPVRPACGGFCRAVLATMLAGFVLTALAITADQSGLTAWIEFKLALAGLR